MLLHRGKSVPVRIASPLAGLIGHNARLRYTQKLNAGNKEILQMQKIRKEIIAFMDDLVKEYTGKTAKSPRHSAFNLDFDTRQAFKG